MQQKELFLTVLQLERAGHIITETCIKQEEGGRQQRWTISQVWLQRGVDMEESPRHEAEAAPRASQHKPGKSSRAPSFSACLEARGALLGRRGGSGLPSASSAERSGAQNTRASG